MNLETIIGLEIHVQLATKSKLFSLADNDAFGAKPNTRVTPVCMGFPGMLPVLNEEALLKCVKGAAALGCEIQKFSKFDRKNYFYPDLPCGYQISQFDKPVSLDGKVLIEFVSKNGEKTEKNIDITRVHLEMDAGKLTHTKLGTLCDYNRSGTPLAEIVTEPDMRSSVEAVALAKEIQKIMRAVGASSADMEKGMMRFDASVSLRPVGDEKLYPRAEIKNLNSFTALGKAIEYEIKRQKALWEAGTPQNEEATVGWSDETQKTRILRKKESAHDYRYFPEPDLPPVTFTDAEIADIMKTIPELPLAKKKRFMADMGLTEDKAGILSEIPALAAFFEQSAAGTCAKTAANLILKVVLAETAWQSSDITAVHVNETVKAVKNNKISSSGAVDVLKYAMEKGGDVKDIIQTLGIAQNSDSGALKAMCDAVIAENPKPVAELAENPDKAEKILRFLMGKVMQKSKGSANPPMVMEMLKEVLGIS